MKNAVWFIVVMCMPFISFSKDNKKERKDTLIADYYYSHLEFHKAIPLYEKAADSFKSPVTYAKLGDCYRLTLQLHEAENAYAKAVNLPGCADIAKLHYAQILMQDTQYVSAAKWLKDYLKTNKGDRRAASLLKGCESAPAMWRGIPSGVTFFQDFNTDGSEFAPTIWKNRVVFASDTVIDLRKKTNNWTGSAYYNIYSVSYAGNGKCGNDFSEFAKTKDLNIKYHDGPCTFSADGSQMYFTRNRYSDKFLSKSAVANDQGAVLLEIMIASDYDSAAHAFKKISPFQYNSDKYSVAHPAVSPDGNVLVFSSTMSGGMGESDLYLCRNAGNGEWSQPVNLGPIVNTEGQEVFPCWGDNQTLFFSSDGHEGLGGLDIYMTMYDTRTQSFSKPQNVGVPLNSSYDDISLAMTASAGSTFFSSNRPAPKGGDNIWYYRREEVFVRVNVYDSLTKRPLADAHYTLTSQQETVSASVDHDGSFFKQLYPQTSYSLVVSDTGYIAQNANLQAADFEKTGKELDTITINIPLLKNETGPKAIYLDLTVIDSATRRPLPGANVVLEGKKDYRNMAVDAGGHLFTRLFADESYIIQCLKLEYATGYAAINTMGAKKTNDTILQTVMLHKISSDTLELGVIPFSFGSYNINDTAKERLDVLVDYLKVQNPKMRIQLLGHTDCRGTDKLNDRLSKQRVQEVVKYLTSKGVAARRLSAAGLGSRLPKIRCTNCQYLNQPGDCSELDHYRNRSLDFRVVSR